MMYERPFYCFVSMRQMLCLRAFSSNNIVQARRQSAELPNCLLEAHALEAHKEQSHKQPAESNYSTSAFDLVY